MIKAIIAIDEKRGLANDHGIPWQGKIPGDVNYYRDKLKSGGIILMGYGLYKELSGPYPGGTNYVATTNPNIQLRRGFDKVTDARKFLEEAKGDVWHTGGAALFDSTFDLIDEIYITQLEGDFGCTKFFPAYEDKFKMIKQSDPITENGITYAFTVWTKNK